VQAVFDTDNNHPAALAICLSCNTNIFHGRRTKDTSSLPPLPISLFKEDGQFTDSLKISFVTWIVRQAHRIEHPAGLD
jgi:hypothetical protein